MVLAALGHIAGVRFTIGGETASDIDADQQLGDRLPLVIATVVLLTVLLTGFVFRSTLLVLCTAAMNLLSAATSFGMLTLVFQHHWADGLLGYTSTGRLINWIPLFTFSVLFGLSMEIQMQAVLAGLAFGNPHEQQIRHHTVFSATRRGLHHHLIGALKRPTPAKSRLAEPGQRRRVGRIDAHTLHPQTHAISLTGATTRVDPIPAKQATPPHADQLGLLHELVTVVSHAT